METVSIYELDINIFYNFHEIYEELVNFAKNLTFKQTYLLNTKFTDENNNFIEKFVFDTAEFHISEYNKKHNMNINIYDIFIEFWCLNDNHFKKMHFDKDEQDYLINNNYKTYRTPFLSCITYLNDNVYAPTLITDNVRKYGSDESNEDCYSGKHTNFGMIFPKKMKQITFDGGKYYHGMYLLDEKCNNRLVLPINFWFKKPTLLSYFPYYSYLRSSNLQKQIISILKKQQKIVFEKKLFYYNKLNNLEIFKIINITINKDCIHEFNKWYEQLICGDTSCGSSFFKEHIDIDKNYVYYFMFTFILDT